MVEREIAFANLEDNMNYAEDYVKFLCQWLLDHCREDMEFMAKNFDRTAIDRLKLVSSTRFERIPYTRAVQLLENVTDKKFENKVEWGMDLASEHERYLTEVIFKKPVIFFNYPKEIKAFYMRLNDDKKTVAAMDVLVPMVLFYFFWLRKGLLGFAPDRPPSPPTVWMGCGAPAVEGTCKKVPGRGFRRGHSDA